MLTKTDIDWLEDTYLPKLADKVKDALSEKLDAISTKLDKFVGQIEDKRKTQELHSGQHRGINDQLEKHNQRLQKLEKHAGIPIAAD